MILSYTFPQFKPLILSGEKKHTLREDPHDRWRVGMSIQHWMGSPRNTRGKTKPEHFADGECKALQRCLILNKNGEIKIGIIEGIWIRILDESKSQSLIKNDGLTEDEFIKYFVPNQGDACIRRIIHFTDDLTY